MVTELTSERKQWKKFLASFVLTTIGVLLFTALISNLQLYEQVANISMLYLFLVILAALVLGRGAAIWTSVASFLAFNWFFVTPRYTFNVTALTDWSVLVVFLFVATVTGQLMALLKARAWEARQHERQAAALAEASWAVASQLDINSALLEVLRQVSKVVDLESAAFVSTETGAPVVVATFPVGADGVPWLETAAETHESLKLPIRMKDIDFGYAILRLTQKGSLTASQQRIIDSLLGHSAIVFQREHLMQAEAKAQALADADRLKTALLSMVSHDFRSPLTSIKASVSTLMEGGAPLDVETKKGLHHAIDQETDRLNRMVGNILDLSRLEADAWHPKLEWTPVSELIGMTLDQFSPDSNKRIDVNMSSSLTEINVDCVQMVQVIKNLVENALKYSKAEERIEINIFRDEDTAVIEVLDRGRGISDADLEHLFEPFYRAKDLQESSVPGVGVGLAVCRGLVEAHRGSLIAKNRDNGGAIFRVNLPMQPAGNP